MLGENQNGKKGMHRKYQDSVTRQECVAASVGTFSPVLRIAPDFTGVYIGTAPRWVVLSP